MISRVYRLVQILSIDIVIGVMILLRFFCVQLGVNPSWEVHVLLGTIVWLIYTTDHLRDAKRSPQSTRERYVFHLKYRKPLILTAIGVAILVIPLVFFIPEVIVFGGFTLAVLSFIYLLIQHKLSTFLSKELYVALVYSLGVLMVPILMSGTFSWVSVILLFLLVFINLILFSWYEKEEDERDGFLSIATQMQKEKLEKLIFILLSIGLGISFLVFNAMHLYFIMSFFIYALLFLFPEKFRENYRYRAIGDGVFLLSVLFFHKM